MSNSNNKKHPLKRRELIPELRIAKRKRIKLLFVIGVLFILASGSFGLYLISNFYQKMSYINGGEQNDAQGATGEHDNEYAPAMDAISALNFSPLLFIFGTILFTTLAISITYAKRHDLFKPLDSFHRVSGGSVSKAQSSFYKPIEPSQFMLKPVDINTPNLNSLELTSISKNFLKQVDLFYWDSELEKERFLNEMLSLTPKEREDLLNYMIDKSNQGTS